MKNNRVVTYLLGNQAIAGMTTRAAGNFWLSQPNTCQGLIFANTVPKLLGDNRGFIHKPERFVLRAEEHTGTVTSWDTRDAVEAVADGVIWEGPGLAVGFPGGCPMAVFSDLNQKVFGMLHCSWLTVSKRIVTNFLTKWKLFGGRTHETTATFLPGICPNCLVFDQRYWEKTVRPPLLFAHKNPEEFLKVRGRKLGFDLIGLSATIMRQSGYEQIETESPCTCHTNVAGIPSFHCYRCDDLKTGPKHRNMAFLYAPSDSTPLGVTA